MTAPIMARRMMGGRLALVSTGAAEAGALRPWGKGELRQGALGSFEGEGNGGLG